MKISFFLSSLSPPPLSFFLHGTERKDPGLAGPGWPAPLGGLALPGQVEPDPVGTRCVGGSRSGDIQGEGAGAWAGAAGGRS